MPVIIIADDDYSEGRVIAEQTAAGLGYRLVNREVLGEISKAWNISEKYLLKVLDESALLSSVSSKRSRRHRAIVQREVLRLLLQVLSHSLERCVCGCLRIFLVLLLLCMRC